MKPKKWPFYLMIVIFGVLLRLTRAGFALFEAVPRHPVVLAEGPARRSYE
jgi:hypothetical protein